MVATHEEENGDIGTGQADLFMNCLIVFMLLMFIFMVKQGVKSATAAVDQDLLSELVSDQEKQLAAASQRAQDMANIAADEREKSRAYKRDMLETQERAEDAANDAARQIKATKANAKTTEQELKDEIEQLEQIVSTARQSRALRIVIAPDCTGSMGEVIETLKDTTSSMTRTLPAVLHEVEIGLVAYRDGRLATLPIEAVKPASEDAGASIRRVNDTVGKLAAVGGVANIEQAIRESMRQIEAAPESPQECLVVIGDVGTSEISPDNPAVAQKLLADVKNWCQRTGKRRRVLAIYTGAPDTEDELFFRSLGGVTPDSLFTTNDSLMFELILTAAFSSEGSNP